MLLMVSPVKRKISMNKWTVSTESHSVARHPSQLTITTKLIGKYMYVQTYSSQKQRIKWSTGPWLPLAYFLILHLSVVPLHGSKEGD